MFNSPHTSKISKPYHDKILEFFGPRFIGHDEGEWDGLYVGRIVVGAEGFEFSPDRSRREACRNYLDWLRAIYERHHNWMASTNSLLFGCHYSAELGARMLGVELGESLPCDTLMLAFCRGACKQFDLLMQTYPSVFSIRGVKVYPRHGQPQSVAFDKNQRVVGPDHGTTLGLLKRHWWCSYMSGASIIGLQFGYFPTNISLDDFRTTHDAIPMTEPVTEAKIKAHFTPLGWLFHESRETAREHPLRGVPYVPIAVMLHHDHGWYPQPNVYSGDRVNCVWGNIPYNFGDRQTEKFFEWVFPGYRLASSKRDERGKVVNMPFGDSFDVILSNATDECLAKYQAVVLLGSWDVSSEEGLAERLERFIHAGGTVIADSSQWTSLPGEIAGEKRNSRPNFGLVTEFPCGKGKMVIVSETAWGADQEDSGTFESVKDLLKGYLQDYELITVEGRPVYYLVNVTDKPDELLITTCNNSHGMPWEGIIRVKGQEISEVEEWLGYGEVDLQDGVLRCGVPANDVRIYRLKMRHPFLPLRFKNIPWRKLGVGVPEWQP